MRHVEGNFKGPRNLEIYHQGWLPDREARAVLLVVHGLGEHGGRYRNVVGHFAPRGYAVYALDHVGHGKSEGKREFVKRFDEYTDTLKTYYDMVKEWQPGKPIFLLGHSMGGAIAAAYLLDHQSDFNGAVLSAPAVKIGDDISPTTITMSKILSRVLPGMGVADLDPNGVSSDPAVVEAYVNDPLVHHGKTPARLAAELMDAIMRITAEAGKITLPMLLLQGSADVLVDPAGTQMLYDTISSEDKTLNVYEGFFHEVFNEPERDRVLEDLDNWLEAHLPG